MSRETKVAAIPDVRDDNVTEVLRAIKNVLQVREGHLGDALDQNVTLRDLTDLNLVNLGGFTTMTGGTRIPVVAPGATPDGYDPTTDLTTPPAPTGLTVAATFSNVYLSWNGAGYRNHAYTEIWRSGTNVIGEAILVGTSISNVYADAARERQTYYYWIRFVSLADVKGPFNATAGTAATTGQDPAAILALLQGQITQSQLYSTLSSRIDLIDAPASVTNSVAYRVAQEAAARATAIQGEAATRAADLLTEASARQTADSALQTQINTIVAVGSSDTATVLAALQEEQTARIDADTAEATARQTLATQMRGNYDGTDIGQVTTGLLYSEASTRSTADTALSESITALSSTVTNNYNSLSASLTTESSTRATADSALSTEITNLSSTVTNNYNTLSAAITSEQTTRSTADSALASSIYLLQSTASGIDVITSFNFDFNTESFVGVNATISWSAGSLRINASNGDPMLYTPTLNIAGSKGYLVRMRVKRLAGSSWDGKLYYNTSSHGESETYRLQIPDNTFTNDWRVLEWDMSSLSDWMASTIINCRIDLGASAADQFLIDWISFGRIAPMPMASQATLLNDYYTKTDTDGAIASATQNLVSNTSLQNTLGSYVTSSTLTNAYYTKTQTDSAISSATSTLVSTTALNNALSNYATTASLQQNYYTKTDTDSAISSANTTLSSSIANTYATTVSLQQNYYTKASGQGLEAQYTVKIDNNGYVSGFGLASTVVNGEPSSLFLVNADRFAIANPYTGRVGVSSIGLDVRGNIINTSSDHSFVVGDTVSFQNLSGYSGKYTVTVVYSSTQFRIGTFSYASTVSSSSYVSKATVPFIVDNGKVYMDTAVIKEASITSAMIGTITADQITTGTLTAAISVNAGMIYGGVNPGSGAAMGTSTFGTGYFLGAYGGSNKFFIGSPYQNVIWNGTILSVKGTITATAGAIGNVIIDANAIRAGQTDYATGTGFFLGSDGTFSVGSSSSGNMMTWNGTTAAFTGNITAKGGYIGGSIIGASNIKSTNFDGGFDSNGAITSSGSVGWAIDKYGSSVFNQITVRSGQVTGALMKINSINGYYPGVWFVTYQGNWTNGNTAPKSWSNGSGPYYFLLWSGTMPAPETVAHKIAAVATIHATNNSGGEPGDLYLAIFSNVVFGSGATAGTFTGDLISQTNASAPYNISVTVAGASAGTYTAANTVAIFAAGYMSNMTVDRLDALFWGVR